MRLIVLILLGILGLIGCGFLYDDLIHDGAGRKMWQEERVLKKITEDDERE